MILALEIIMTLAGLWMLIMGKGWGKEAVSHWQYRLLGLFMLSLWPVMFAAMLIMGIVWAVNHPNVAPEKAAEDMKYPLMGVEFGLVIVYAIIASLWDKAVRKRFGPAAPAPTPVGGPTPV